VNLQTAALNNTKAYLSPEVVSHYADLNYLTPCERVLFSRYITPGMSVLDVGVGGGRTARFLSERPGRYVAIDCSEAMLRQCRHKFPELEFLRADASDLTLFPNASFDCIVMAFNVLGHLVPGSTREGCLAECRRVLKNNGLLIFSLHNPRALLVLPAWNSGRIEKYLGQFLTSGSKLFRTLLVPLKLCKAATNTLFALALTVVRTMRKLNACAFWSGSGYIFDPSHGGLSLYMATPSETERELQVGGFQLLEFLGDDYPRRSHALTTDWYYYVARSACEEKSLCA